MMYGIYGCTKLDSELLKKEGIKFKLEAGGKTIMVSIKDYDTAMSIIGRIDPMLCSSSK